jgi:acyl carrier protein
MAIFQGRGSIVTVESFKSALAEILEVAPENLVDDLQLDGNNWDSVALMSTVALIDENFGITLPSKELDGCTSVKGLMRLIDLHVAAEDAKP